MLKSKSNAHSLRSGWNVLLTFAKTSQAVIIAPALALSIASGFLQPIMAIFLGKFFDAFAQFGLGILDGEHLMRHILVDVFALVGLGGATWIFQGASFTAWLLVGELQAKTVRDELFQALVEKEIQWYESQHGGISPLLTRLQTQIQDFQLSTSQPLGFAFNYGVQAIVALGLAFYYSWRLTLVILSTIPIAALGLSLTSARIQFHVNGLAIKMTRSSRRANNAISNIVMLKYFNTQESEIKRYSRVIQEGASCYLKAAMCNGLQIGFMRFVTISMFVQGKIATTFWACMMATKAFDDILPQILVLEKGRASAAALKEILARIRERTESRLKADEKIPDYCEGDIEVREVSFAYPSRPQHSILNDASFFFPAGETTFVIDKSGSGKSSLANLIMRFYEPTIGSILIDGSPLKNLSLNWLRNNVTLVAQQSTLFDESIFRNIALGRHDHQLINPDQVQASIDLAILRETISGMPRGLDTFVGARGATLSGGQRQRIAIARARLRDTPILIIDKGTSAFDHVSRTTLMSNIRAWRQNKTTIVITHDISDIHEDDSIYMVEDGRVTREGFRKNIDIDVVVDDAQNWSPDLPNSKQTTDHDVIPLPFDQGENSVGDERGDVPSNMVAKVMRQFSNAAALRRTFSSRFGVRESFLLGPVGEEAFQPLQGNRDSQRPTFESNLPDRKVKRARLSRPVSILQPWSATIYRAKSLSHNPLPNPPLVGNPKPSLGPSLRPDLMKKKEHDILGRSILVIGFLAALVHAAGAPTFSYIVVQIFHTFYIKQDHVHKALTYSFALLSVAAVDCVAAFLMHYLLESASQTWVDAVRIEALQRIIEQEKAWFDAKNSSSLTTMLDRNPEEMRNLVGRFFAVIVVVATMLVIAIIWSLAICWKITLVTVAASPLLYVITKTFDFISSNWESRSSRAAENVAAIFAETFSDIRTVRSLTLEAYFHKKYRIEADKTFKIGVNRALYGGFFFGFSESILNFMTALAFWFGAYLARSHEFSVQAILTAFSLMLFSIGSANVLTSYLPQISSSVGAASHLLYFARLPLRSHEFSDSFKLDRSDPTCLSGPINFINLTFHYPNQPESASLERLNLTILPGQCTAIVGSSGSGKSTLASLLLGLYPPSADESARTISDPLTGPASLTLSGRDIRSLHLPTLRSVIAIVPQNPILLPATVRENIAYGLDLNSELSTDSSIQDAAERAGIHDFIQSLPQGYDTVIGDDALCVSGGEAQRIAIARALVRRPIILILDEPTSALDATRADVVRQTLLHLLAETQSGAGHQGGRGKGASLTVIVITHAREMMRGTDTVVVMERGSVVEQGGFQELLRRKGKLFEMLKPGGG